MTIADVLTALAVLCATAFLAYYTGHEVGVMQGTAAGRARGYEQCLGAIDSDDDARKVWRASR